MKTYTLKYREKGITPLGNPPQGIYLILVPADPINTVYKMTIALVEIIIKFTNLQDRKTEEFLFFCIFWLSVSQTRKNMYKDYLFKYFQKHQKPFLKKTLEKNFFVKIFLHDIENL